jgi:hypothetical protein
MKNYGMTTEYIQSKPKMQNTLFVNNQSKTKNKPSKIFHLPPNTFVVDLKYEMRENCFVDLTKLKLTKFLILIDLAMTGHKLAGMMKKMVVSSLNYGTANWNYVVLSRVTSIKAFIYFSC